MDKYIIERRAGIRLAWFKGYEETMAPFLSGVLPFPSAP